MPSRPFRHREFMRAGAILIRKEIAMTDIFFLILACGSFALFAWAVRALSR